MVGQRADFEAGCGTLSVRESQKIWVCRISFHCGLRHRHLCHINKALRSFKVSHEFLSRLKLVKSEKEDHVATRPYTERYKSMSGFFAYDELEIDCEKIHSSWISEARSLTVNAINAEMQAIDSATVTFNDSITCGS